MKKILTLAVTLLASTLIASPPTWGTDVSKALTAVKKERKMGFILMGREDCGNCNAIRKMINEGAVPVNAEKFVIADINVDDSRDSGEFRNKFKDEKFGTTLPLVVITDTRGKVITSFGGFKSASELTAMITEASAKAQASVKK